LAAAGIPRVPSLRRLITSDDGKLGLLMTPVGIPLIEYCSELEDGARKSFACRMVAQVYETVAAAHRAGFHHGDLRPSNLIVVPRVDSATSASGGAGGGGPGLDDLDVYVVDWGLGEDCTTSQRERSRGHLHGVRAFMALVTRCG
jgi:tRNA A-37 threonylcarbamoyl transferase component Bud32